MANAALSPLPPPKGYHSTDGKTAVSTSVFRRECSVCHQTTSFYGYAKRRTDGVSGWWTCVARPPCVHCHPMQHKDWWFSTPNAYQPPFAESLDCIYPAPRVAPKKH